MWLQEVLTPYGRHVCCPDIGAGAEVYMMEKSDNTTGIIPRPCSSEPTALLQFCKESTRRRSSDGFESNFQSRRHRRRDHRRRDRYASSVKMLMSPVLRPHLGIGLTMARALVSQGAAKVYILGRRLQVLEAAAKEHPNLIPHKCDVTSKEDLQSIVNRITKEVGYVNLVIANSGVLGPSVRFNPAHSVSDLKKILFDDFSMTEMTEVLHVNITAAFFTMSAFLELLDAGNKNALKGGFGKPDQEGSDVIAIQSQVIFTSSISAFSRHFSSTPPYLASKTAIMQLTKQASSQLARHGIRVNGIAPGRKYHRSDPAAQFHKTNRLQYSPQKLLLGSSVTASQRRSLLMIRSSFLRGGLEGMRR